MCFRSDHRGPLRLRFSNANAVGLRSNQRPTPQHQFMASEDGLADVQFPLRWQFYQANDAAVRLPVSDRQGTEILVASDDDALFGVSLREDFVVAGSSLQSPTNRTS